MNSNQDSKMNTTSLSNNRNGSIAILIPVPACQSADGDIEWLPPVDLTRAEQEHGFEVDPLGPNPDQMPLELRNTCLEEEGTEAKAFGDLVGQSAALRRIESQIDVVAPTEASVLILGETGTGKELVAHEIHRRSARKEGPLVRVNCASIPRELFESEFFGHVKGAFTGAVRDRAGRFETAEGGTIFLDEVGEIPLDIQNKLLRVLQEKRYERVGGDVTRRANVRIVAATNRDLKKAVAAGRFREDLYYRLNVFPIRVPPLRERMDDIPLLAKHFVELSTRELKCAKPRLTRAAVAKLQNYDWPGNVRELCNLIERAVILARGGALDFDLPVGTPSALPSQSAPATRRPPAALLSPSSSPKRNFNAWNVTTCCWSWKQPTGRSKDWMAPPSFSASSPPRCFPEWQSGGSRNPNADRPEYSSGERRRC